MTQAPEVRRGGNLPFGMVASRWMCDPRYSANARTLYAILVSYADTQGRDTGQAKPFRKELAAQLGVHLSTLDRTIDELEAAGLIAVERRGRIDRAGVNDANLYHLNDAGVMWQGNGTWIDPLPPGKAAAEVVKERTEKRRRAKREAGIIRKGGVAKGVNTRAGHAASSSAENHSDAYVQSGTVVGIAGGQTERPVTEFSEGGSSIHAATSSLAATSHGTGGRSTHAATGGSTYAAGVAARVLPFIKNPVQNPSPDAPSARSAADARRASHLSNGPGRGGGDAAPDAGKPTETRRFRTLLLPDDVAYVIAAYPADLAHAVEDAAGHRAPRGLVAAVTAQLAERTPEQLAERVARRWHTHGHAASHENETLVRPVGVAIALVRAGECGNARCEDGLDLDTGAACRACAERRVDRKASRKATARRADRADTPAAGSDVGAAVEALPAPRHGANSSCPGCGFPGTDGKHCAACSTRDVAYPDDAVPRPGDRRLRPETATRTPARSEQRRCTRCHTRTGRDRWGGLCGPCRATSNPVPAPARTAGPSRSVIGTTA
ncbi:hypothetical protein [Streptodolium elevatio]